jgi:DNA primase|tara:strand:- start:949 stop:1872 length:924 start_codon:yes stop_codon:yes gene_type:complete
MDYTFLLGSIENILGKSQKRARDNYAFHCPFCNHRKPKLEISMVTNEEGKNFWECWVCKSRGQSIYSLVKQLNLPKSEAQEVLKYVKKGIKYEYKSEDVVELPKEFQSLVTASNTSIIANKIRKYLNERGLTHNDFIKHNIGYTTTGDYGGRIIIPSYSESNRLNYFVGRTYEGAYFKYKNPEASKDIVFFENHINWNKPVILCEGAFDAMSIRRNAIPILGKSLSPALWKRLLTGTLTDIYIALDTDAQKQALEIAEKLIAAGFRVFLIELLGKDPSDMGFKEFTKLVQNATELDFSKIMLYKLDL